MNNKLYLFSFLLMLLSSGIFAHSSSEKQLFFDYYIKDKPKGIVRDFYIWQYLNENKLQTNEINVAYTLLNTQNPYIKKTLQKLGKTQALPEEAQCMQMNIQDALQKDAKCLFLAVNSQLSKFKTMPKAQIDLAIKKLSHSKTYASIIDAIKILSSPQKTQKLFDSNAAVFAMVYNALNSAEKQKITSKNPSQSLESLSKQNVPAFFNIINTVALSSQTSTLKNMILQSYITEAPHQTLFLLGINELRFGSKQKALAYFKQTEQSTTLRFYKDRALLWQYLLTQDKYYLEELAQSKNVNIFSIYAIQKLNKKPLFDIVYDIPHLSKQKPPFNTQDPYLWQEIASLNVKNLNDNHIAQIIAHLSYEETKPQLAYILQKKDNFTKHYYIVPYQGLISWETQDEQSFVLSIARQESQFIPTAISRSFALGMMQVMPAYVKPFAQEMGKKNVEYNDMFNPKIALEIGRYYIKKLQKEYKHPLFVAYAYNGGPTFLRKLLSKNELFIKNRAFEPWISMELIPYEETRLYGMRVLANFIIYQNFFGKNISIEHLLKQTLIYPK